MNLVDLVNKKHENANVKSLPAFRTGDTVAVHNKIKEGNKERIQIYEGVCISMSRKNSINASFTVRKISSGVGVERVFPFHSPNVTKIDIVQKGKSRRAKHYYLRERAGKSARIEIDYDRD